MTRVSPQLRRDAFATRAAFVADASVNSLPNGYEVVAGGYAYRRNSASTALPDKAGWDPVAPYHLEHWGVVTADTPAAATTSYQAQVAAALAWVQGDLLFTGWVKLTDGITLGPNVRLHSVRGHDRGGFRIATDFNLSAPAVVTLSGVGAEGCDIGEFGWDFAQPDAPATRGDLVAYPWALDISTATRVQIGRLRIQKAWRGVKAVGNFGGVKAEVIEIGAFDHGCHLAGALDFCHFANIHLWPFGFSSNATLLALYADGVGVGATLGRMDGGHISTLQVYRQSVVLNSDTLPIKPVQIGALELDGDGARLVGLAGRWSVNLLMSSKTVVAQPTIDWSGGEIYIDQINMGGSESTAMAVTGGFVAIDGGRFSLSGAANTGLEISGGSVWLRDILLQYITAGRTTALLRQSGSGNLRIINCVGSPDVTMPNLVEWGAPTVGCWINCPQLVLPVYANEAAAVTGGLLPGTVYHTATGEMRVKL